MYFKHDRSNEKNILLKQIIYAVVLLNSCFFIRENEDTNYFVIPHLRFFINQDKKKLVFSSKKNKLPECTFWLFHSKYLIVRKLHTHNYLNLYIES